MRFGALLAMVAVTGVAGTAVATPLLGNHPVVGGTEVPAGKWPDAVAVLGTNGSCTGTLIAPDVVLTAGHCAEANPTRVVADTTDYHVAGGKIAQVASVTAYPDWEHTYDVSVIVLATPIVGVTPRPIGTAFTFDDFHAAMAVHLVGFGSTDEQGTTTNSQLREASAPVIDPECLHGEGCIAAIAPGGEFVAGGDGKDSCFGDSGGPVYLDTPRGAVVIAAVSRGIDGVATPCGGGGIYVRTDKLVQWIEETTGRTVAKDTGDPADAKIAVPAADAMSDGGCAAGGSGSGGALAMLVLGVVATCRKRRR